MSSKEPKMRTHDERKGPVSIARRRSSVANPSVIDWAEIHRRLEETRKRLDQGWTRGREEKKKILRDRARALAQAADKQEPEGFIEVLEFLLAYERYGVESSHVREVCVLKDLTPLPGTPPFVSGIVNVRGRVLSIIDLKKFFDLPEKGLGDLNKVIILSSPEMEFGILADVILGTRRVSLNDLQPSLPTLTGIRADYLRGVTGDRLVVLDAGKVLADKRILINTD